MARSVQRRVKVDWERGIGSLLVSNRLHGEHIVGVENALVNIEALRAVEPGGR